MLRRIAIIFTGLVTTGVLAGDVAAAAPAAHTSVATMAAAPADSDPCVPGYILNLPLCLTDGVS